MMNLARPFKIQNGADFSLSHLEDMSSPKEGAMVRPFILVMVNIEGFALCKDNLWPFRNHYAIFEATI
jgi:hypothetical protein